jgi:hypothetical protein
MWSMSYLLKICEPSSDTPVLQPQSVLPEQFFGSFRSQMASQTGESRLLVAVLEEAVGCFQQNAFARSHQQRRLFAEAEQWIMNPSAASRGDAHAPRFSFEFICSVLDLDADYLRGGLRRWRETHVERARAAG